MNLTSFVLRIVGLSLAAASAVCLILAHLNQIDNAIASLFSKKEKCGKDSAFPEDEFCDWDE